MGPVCNSAVTLELIQLICPTWVKISLDLILKILLADVSSSSSLTNYNLVEDGKDKLILSKGHAVPILYAVLYELGLIDTLENFREII